VDRAGRRRADRRATSADNEHDEAAFVARTIDPRRRARVKPGDVAVFYRTNAQSRAIEEVFVRVGLPYKVVGGTRFYERKEVKDALAYLRVLANPADTVNLRRILNVPKRGIGDRAEAAIAALADRERIPFVEALGRAGTPQGSRPGRSPASRDLHCAPRGAAEPSATSDISGSRTCSRQSSIAPGISRSCAPARTRRTRPGSRTLHELVSVAREFDEVRVETGEVISLDDFLEQVSLVADADEIPDGCGTDRGVVTLMTLHTAKGLEFPVVFLTGLEDGTFPTSAPSGDPKELEEERRLAYVGITRARERLHCQPGQRAIGLGRTPVQPGPAASSTRSPRPWWPGSAPAPLAIGRA
jgi:DNA helicase-2/ATP-dependent DNA helicase PcrA